jgi:LCP family protein required for cell wall assembly
VSEDRPEQGGEGDVPGPPEEQEEKGLGLTEEFARLEEEIQREVGGAPDPGDQEHADEEEPAGEEAPGDAEAADFGETDSSEWVAPAAAGGDTEEWSQVEGEEAPTGDDSDGEEGEPGSGELDEAELPAGGEDQADGPVPAEAPPAAEEESAIEHTVVRHGPPPVPIAAASYDQPDEDPVVKSPGLWWRFLTASTVIIVAVATAVSLSALLAFNGIASDLNTIPHAERYIDQIEPGEPQTILIVGSDKRASTPGDPGRSDTTMLLRVDPEKGVLSLFSLPRDLKVDIAGANYGTAKLNEAFTDGGVTKTAATVKNLTGLEINHIVNVDFEGFAKAVDAIGCVYVDVDRHYFNDNSLATSSLDTYAEININAGYQRLCGQQALDYVRYRHTDTDIVRAARQQDFLRNARSQVPVSEVLPIIGGNMGSKLIDIFTKYTASDIKDPAQMIDVLKTFLGVRDVPINQISFDGTLGTSYVTASHEQIKKAVDEFLNGKDTPGPMGGKDAVADKGGKDKSKDKKEKSKSPSDGANVIPTSEVLDVNTGIDKFAAFGRTSARRLKFPVYVPTAVVPGSSYSGDSRQYDIKDEDDKKHQAYKMVIEYSTPSTLPEYYGVQGTEWSDPPILEKPSDTITSDGRDYDIYYDGDRIRMVAWHDDDDNSYWVSNTLLQTLDNADMIAIAESMEEAHG